MRPLFALIFFVCCCCLSAATSAHAAGGTFPARVRLALCPEYKLGGVSLEIKYSIGTDPTLYDAPVAYQMIDPVAGTGVLNILLPNNQGTSNLTLRAYCRNVNGLGTTSNTLSTSNCAAIALRDTDADGLTDDKEDTNCDNTFSPEDVSNMLNVDSDVDGVRDLAEVESGADPRNPASSPKPIIFSGAPFDPDGDGSSNPVVYRPSLGMWFVKDYTTPGNTLQISLGALNDIPFTYTPRGQTRSDVGVIRELNGTWVWLFRGFGFIRSNDTSISSLTFGLPGDAVFPGAWEEVGMTTPALARNSSQGWQFLRYLRNGTTQTTALGEPSDIPRPADYDGDGIFDAAVFRPSTGETLVLQSTSGLTLTYSFGGGAFNYSLRGDVTGDGQDDISFWDLSTGTFKTLLSDGGFTTQEQFTLGNPEDDFPLAWNRLGGKLLYTIVNHAAGTRSYKVGNSPAAPTTTIEWGLPGDAHG